MVDYSRSVVDGCCYIHKFRLDRFYSFGDSAFFRFSLLAWNCLFTPTFREFLEHFPEMTSPITLNRKRILLAWKHIICTIKCENYSSSVTHACDQKKYRTVKKVTKCYISPSRGEVPAEPICTKIWVVVAVPHVITCPKNGTEIFRGYNFTGVEFFGFPIDSCMGLTTGQR